MGSHRWSFDIENGSVNVNISQRRRRCCCYTGTKNGVKAEVSWEGRSGAAPCLLLELLKEFVTDDDLVGSGPQGGERRLL